MSLGTAKGLSAPGRQSADRDALVYFDMFAYDRRLTYNDAGTVVHEEVFPDGRTRMDVDTGPGVRVLRHHSGDQRHSEKKQLVSKPVHCAGQKPWVAENDLFLIVSRGISLVESFHVGVDELPDGRDPADECDRQFLRDILDLRFRRLHVFIAETQRDCDLLGKVVDDVLDQNTDPAVVIVAPVILLPVVAGKKDVEQLIDYIRNSIAVRLAEYIHLVYVSAVLVILQYILGDLPDPLVDHLLVRHRLSTPFGHGPDDLIRSLAS